MPCVSDPGAVLVNCCIENQIEYDVLPGANALLTAYAIQHLDRGDVNVLLFIWINVRISIRSGATLLFMLECCVGGYLNIVSDN